MTIRAAVVIPAAGSGRRFGGVFKPFAEMAGEPVLKRSLAPFLADRRVRLAVVALPARHVADPPDWLRQLAPRVVLVEGGEERADSVGRALARVPADIDVVLVHDAARPLVSATVIERTIEAAAAGRSVIAAVPATDTVQVVDADHRIVETPDRATLWLAQTPQAFPRDVLTRAYEQARTRGLRATDDAALVIAAGGTVEVLEGDRDNLKITVPSDLAVAEVLLALRVAR